MKRLLHTAIANGASDLLITSGSKPSLRLDGDLKPLDTEPLTPSDTKRLLFSLLNAKQRETFEEQREIDFALSINISRTKDGKTENSIPYRFRINGFFQRGNVAIAVRVIPKKIPRPEELGLPKVLLDIAKKSQGLILVTGPTGHGKSTTLASMINILNENRACHIITIEDPIEYVHENKKAVVEQREVYADTLSFSNALKYVLRQDPDVILVGEMRDRETIELALRAAETGHLVMTTLHTNSCAQTIGRIIDSFPENAQEQVRTQLGMMLQGVVTQKLLPKIGGGRVLACEIMIGTPAIQSLIRENKVHQLDSMIQVSQKYGMMTFNQHLVALVKDGLIEKETAIHSCNTEIAVLLDLMDREGIR